mmetsp:Transcript_12755/g.38192  ORF Transcript_12755/g.38192 Transcript_12755/m.38192 type:complete len:1002 (+) Transcript_12755:1276-4281(+)
MKTPRQITSSQKIRGVLDNGMLRRKCDIRVPMDRLKLFMCGDGNVGKSSVARALKRSGVSAFLHSMRKAIGMADDSQSINHGFDVISTTIPGAGNCSIWDFAGRTEHWLPQGIIMASACAVFIVVCNLSDPIETQLAQVRFWMRFVASRAQPEAKPRVALVGTHRNAAKEIKLYLKEHFAEVVGQKHADLVARAERLAKIKEVKGRWKWTAIDEYVASLHDEFADLLDMAPRMFCVDAIDPTRSDQNEMRRLRTWISERFAEVRQQRLVPQVCFDVERVLPDVRRHLPIVAPFRSVFREIQRAAAKHKFHISSDEEQFRAVLNHLTKAGEVMCFEEINDSVVLNPHVFGDHIVGRLFCPGDSGVIVNKRDGSPYLFRQSNLESALQKSSRNLGEVKNILSVLESLDIIFPWTVHTVAPWETPPDHRDPLYAIPGRLCQDWGGEGGVAGYDSRPTHCWMPTTGHDDRWHHLGVRLDITSAQLIIPPSAFPRLQSQLSRHTGFRMWRNGVGTSTSTLDGHTEVESLVEMHDSLQWIDVCVRSGLGSEKTCVQLLLELVTMCERLGAQFRATIISVDAVRAGTVGNVERVDIPGAINQSEEDARRSLPSQWLRAQFSDLLNPTRIYFDRPEPGPYVIVMSHDPREVNTLWQVAWALREAGFLVFNGAQINPNEERDAIFYDKYLNACSIGLVLLSESYFASRARQDELKMMHNERKAIIPIKAAPFGKPPMQLDRMIGSHIPLCRARSAECFIDAFEVNMRLLIKALVDAGARRSHDCPPDDLDGDRDVGVAAPADAVYDHPVVPSAAAMLTTVGMCASGDAIDRKTVKRAEPRHPFYFDRPEAGSNVIVVSYATKNKDAMWQVANGLRELGFHVFNGGQILPGEEWDDVYFNLYLEKCKVGLVLLSEAFFESRPCRDELKMMYSQEKMIIPIKVGPFSKPPLQFVRMLGNHIPMCDRSTPDIFAHHWDDNMHDLTVVLERGLRGADACGPSRDRRASLAPPSL